MCENTNGFNNIISGKNQIAKALDIKEDLGIDCLMYCKHCLNLRHKENKNDFKQLFQREIACTAVAAHNIHKGQYAGQVQEGGTGTVCLVLPWDTSRRWGKTRKDLAVRVGYYLGGRTDTTPI
jgi:hypothetical protein